MTRTLSFALLFVGVVSTARADRPVAPPPREVRPDGSRDPVPAPKKENPLEVVERIIKNSKDVGDKLAMTDPGPDTRKTQEKILKDIDALLNQDDPPKSDNDKDKEKDKDKDKDKDKEKNKDDMPEPKDKKKDMDPMGGKDDTPPKKNDMEPMGGMGGMDDQPMGDQPKERRPRQGGDKKQELQPKDTGANEKEPMGGKQKEPPKNPGGGKTPDPKKEGKPDPNRPFPSEDDVVKDVWGHLPDKLRQQATQYYREEFMPRYSDLLRLYYSSLSERK